MAGMVAQNRLYAQSCQGWEQDIRTQKLIGILRNS